MQQPAIQSAVKGWRKQGVSLLAPLPRAVVVAAFQNAGLELSRDVAFLYSLCNGMAPEESTEHVFAMWPVEQCLAECERHEQPLVPFADFLISSHEYCFRFESPDHSSVLISGQSPDGSKSQVAASVEEFFWLLVHSPKQVHAYVNGPEA